MRDVPAGAGIALAAQYPDRDWLAGYGLHYHILPWWHSPATAATQALHGPALTVVQPNACGSKSLPTHSIGVKLWLDAPTLQELRDGHTKDRD
jgi:hypothetical protein